MNLNIENFQSIADAQLKVEGFTAVTGPSNRGKSASLRAVAGALFNKAGDDFVRIGASKAEVTLDGMPTCQPGATGRVTWTKGHGVNRFRVDGHLYDKVGSKAPALLEGMGYHDIWVGDKERDKGEALRPQVAGQFDGLFLLGRPGSFIAETLALISRVSTLRTAHGRAVSDLRAIKQLRGVRAKDLDTAQEALERLTPVRALDTRAEGLKLRMDGLEAQQTRLAALGAAVSRRAAWGPVAALALPSPVIVPGDLGVTLARGRGLLARRRTYEDLAVWLDASGWLLPKSSGAEATAAVAEADRCTRAQVLALRHKALTRAVATPLPKAFRSDGLADAADRIVQLRAMVQRREAQLRDLFERKRALAAIAGELEDTEVKLEALLASFKECPVCGGPMNV